MPEKRQEEPRSHTGAVVTQRSAPSRRRCPPGDGGAEREARLSEPGATHQPWKLEPVGPPREAGEKAEPHSLLQEMSATGTEGK